MSRGYQDAAPLTPDGRRARLADELAILDTFRRSPELPRLPGATLGRGGRHGATERRRLAAAGRVVDAHRHEHAAALTAARAAGPRAWRLACVLVARAYPGEYRAAAADIAAQWQRSC